MARGGKRPGAGRPKGSPSKVCPELRAAAREYTLAALEVVVAGLSDENGTVRLRAAEMLWDRGWGKAPQPQTGEGGTGPIQIAFVTGFADDQG